jgi:arylsulfatase A-like enzyme
MNERPNVVFAFGDQWRQQATGYAGDPNVRTPHLDRLATESVNFTHAISGWPVCSPYRASLLTGQRPLTHGVFVNDVCLGTRATSIAQAFAGAGYDTAYIGKWHLDGHGRSRYIPPERRQGFAYWKVLECTHDYNDSAYYAGDSEEMRRWGGYDAIAQTRDAQRYIREHAGGEPFFLMLSWGPPHNPYGTAPEKFTALYDPATIQLRPNVPEALADQARKDLAGYYAHCSALDACVGDLLATLDACGIAEETIFVFTSDHGDLLGSQGPGMKQRPWDESIRVPFLLRYSGMPGWCSRETNALIDAPDIMPTLLGLCRVPVPETVDGLDFSDHLRGGPDPSNGEALIMCPHPFADWSASARGGREYRGLRTRCHTYVRDLRGPWLLYDNEQDPLQLSNLVDDAGTRGLRDGLDARLQRLLDARGDRFLPGCEYLAQWGYETRRNGEVPYAL